MNWELMFPGKYLKSAEMEGNDVTYTIKSVVLDDLPEEKGGTKRRGILGFNESQKLLVLNRTNATCIVRMFGTETNGWIGKKVTLFPAPFTDPFTGEVGTAVRVRGSPEIDGTISFQAKVGRKQASFKLTKTAQPGAQTVSLNVTSLPTDKLTARATTLRAWLASAAPKHPSRLQTELEISVIEKELDRRAFAADAGDLDGPPPHETEATQEAP